jgi:uncharacterized membrane protein HdeD (DUF308 family)
MDWNLNVLRCPPAGRTDLLEKDRRWFTAVGIISIVLGAIAIGIPLVVTVATVVALGAILLINGIVQGYRALRSPKGNEFLMHIIVGILYVVVGFLMLFDPGIGALSLAILIAAFFIVTGFLRIVASLAGLVLNRGWALFNGIVGVILGLLIWASWPLSGLWIIGLFVGIEMLVFGWSMIMAGFVSREAVDRLCAPSGA